MKSRPRARPLPRDAGRTRPPPSKRETGPRPGPPNGKQTGPFRPSQREAGPHPAFSTDHKPTSGLRKGSRAAPRPSQREANLSQRNSSPPRPSQREVNLSQWSSSPPSAFQPQPAFSTDHKPTSGLPKGKRAASRPSQREANLSQRNSSPPTAFSTGNKPFPTEYGPAPAFAQGKGRLRAGPFPFHSSAATKPPLRSER